MGNADSRLYLVRHGEAKPKDEDPERGLTDTGREDVNRMAAWARAAGVRVDEIRHSGKLRAEQTAQIFGQHLGTKPGAARGLAPNDDVAEIAKVIESEHGELIMLVGHLPFLERLASLLITGDAKSGVVALDAGAVLELIRVNDAWRTNCLMQPKLLPST